MTPGRAVTLVQSRLSATAHLKGLVSVHQAGSLPGVSAEDAAARLMHEIDATHRSGLCATTGFFDIKGGFDNVSHPVLLDRLTSLGAPVYLVSWSESFLSNRSITLVYPGAPNLSVPVSVGVPQGSPISPLFFVIYVAPLHAPDGISFSLSFVDDFSLTVASTSYEQNSSKLIAAFDSLTTQGSAISVPFAPEKTEVIHWETYRQRSPAPLSPIQLGGQSITPSTRVRWLGFWFDQRRTGAVHFQKRAASAAIALRSLRTLSSPAKGLTPQNVRHLVQLVLRPRLLYGASIFSREVDLRPMRAVWHSAAQWILGAFKTTPTT